MRPHPDQNTGLRPADSKANDPIACDSCPVREISVCAMLPREQRKIIANRSHNRKANKGDVLALEGDRVTHVASVTSGVVKMTKTLSDGRQQIVGLAFASDVVGRPFADDTAVRIEAATDATLCSFEKSHFEQLLREHPAFESLLLKVKLDELDAAKDWMLLLGRKSALEKVASFLAMLADRQLAPDGTRMPKAAAVTVELPLSRAEIADYLGLTLETVSRQFSKLKDAGVIVLDDGRAVTVPDRQKLAALAGN